MINRKPVPHVEPTQHLRTEIVIGKRTFKLGDLVKVSERRGLYVIRQIRDSDEITVVGGPHKDWHTFTADRIRYVRPVPSE